MTPQELKNSILQIAIQGKLVEQRPEEGTAEELYRQIQEEKLRLIKEGKIRKEKPLPEISEDEKPFEVPESWKWVRIGSILHKLVDGTHKTPKYTTLGVPFVSVRNISNGRLNLDNTKFISEEEHKQLFERCNPEKGDILLSKVGTTGVPAKVDTDAVFSLFVSVALLKFNITLIDIDFLIYAILTPDFQKQCKEHTRGVGNKNWVIADIANTVFPLPPLSEQKRIVAKIEELLPYMDCYEQAWSRLEDFNKRFPDDIKKSILQMAIQGRLVEQRPEEGTAVELYQQIQAEKQQLIKAGKIKKEKPLPKITEDEVPFKIPESWKWVRLGNAAWFFDAGKSPNCQKQSVKGNEWGVITTTSIQLGFFDDIQNKVLPDNFVVKKSMQVEVGDILITRAGPTNRTGIACLVKDCRFNLILSDKTLRINMTDQYIYKDYVVMVLNSPQIRQMIIGLMSGMDKQQVNISQDKYRTLLIPIPPLEEQKRIVAKLEELLPLCERLK